MIAFLGLISLFAFFVFAVMSVVSLIRKKGTFKRNALISGISFVLFIILMAVYPSENDTDTAEENKNNETENVEVEQNENEEKEMEKTAKTEENENGVKESEKQNEDEDNEETNNDEKELSWDDVKEKDSIVGKSNKDFLDLSKNKPTDVRNDKTGRWRKITLAENIDIEEYALSYQELYMKEDEIHFIVNFTRNTTTWLSNMNGLLYIDIRERVDKEEHDASTLGSGMVLKSYVIYPDGDIQEIEE